MNRCSARAIFSALVLSAAIAIATVACSGGGDDDDTDTPTAAARTASSTGTASTADATEDATTDPNASPGAQPTSNAGSTQGAGGTSGTPAPSNPSAEFEATIVAEAGGDIAGGDPSQPQQPVGDVPTPPPGATVDDDEIAPPDPPQAGMQVIVDMDATTAGIQSARNVSVGDVIKVAIVGANLPADGIAAFNFSLDYDKTKIVAPSYTGGSSTDRNPDFNSEALGDGWTCLPTPEGDVDDPGGINGDGNPATGSALLSCFIVGNGSGGTLVLATVEFRVVAAGNSPLTLNTVAIVDSSATQVARCEQDSQAGAAAAIPCTPASVTAQ